MQVSSIITVGAAETSVQISESFLGVVPSGDALFAKLLVEDLEGCLSFDKDLFFILYKLFSSPIISTSYSIEDPLLRSQLIC